MICLILITKSESAFLISLNSMTSCSTDLSPVSIGPHANF